VLGKKDKDSILLDTFIRVASQEAIEKEMAALPSNEELNAKYKPSPELDKRIRKIIHNSRKQSKARWRMRIGGKAAVCITAFIAVTFGVLISVQATRNIILNAIIEWHEKNIKIEFQEPDAGSNNIFRPTYMPRGYSEISATESGNTFVIIYLDENGNEILFTQRRAETTSLSADSEYHDYVEIQVNGEPGYLLEARQGEQSSILAWQEGSSLFTLTASVEANELVKIGESVKR
jgi:hypothetical protein